MYKQNHALEKALRLFKASGYRYLHLSSLDVHLLPYLPYILL